MAGIRKAAGLGAHGVGPRVWKRAGLQMLPEMGRGVRGLVKLGRYSAEPNGFLDGKMDPSLTEFHWPPLQTSPPRWAGRG